MVTRYETRLGVEIGSFPSLADWLARLTERPAIAVETELAAAVR